MDSESRVNTAVIPNLTVPALKFRDLTPLVRGAIGLEELGGLAGMTDEFI